MKNVIIVGGYGMVGKEVAKILVKHSNLKITVAGRNEKKAKQLALELNINWLFIDADDLGSIERGLVNQDIIINCFIDAQRINVNVAKMAIKHQKTYLDVAGTPNEHFHALFELEAEAKQNQTLLITGLGINPGFLGVFLNRHISVFDEVLESNVYFVLGANLEEVSVLSLKGLGNMIKVPAKIWQGDQWVKPSKTSKQMKVGTPFQKKIFFGIGLPTPDLLEWPKLHNIKTLRFWSAFENFWQFLAFMIGEKMGYTKTDKKAERLLSWLKWFGKDSKYHLESSITIRTKGKRADNISKQEIHFYASEVYGTALAAALACLQLVESNSKQVGIYYASEIIDHQDFVDRLKKDEQVHFEEKYFEEPALIDHL